MLYTKDHNPVHVHAHYGNAEVKVLLYEKDDAIKTVRYEVESGKLSPSKMNDLKTFISKYKYIILYAHKQIRTGGKVKKIVITKRIK